MDLVEAFARIPSCKCTFLEATYPNLPTAVELYRRHYCFTEKDCVYTEDFFTTLHASFAK